MVASYDLEPRSRSHIERVVDLVQRDGDAQRRKGNGDVKFLELFLGPLSVFLSSVNLNERNLGLDLDNRVDASSNLGIRAACLRSRRRRCLNAAAPVWCSESQSRNRRARDGCSIFRIARLVIILVSSTDNPSITLISPMVNSVQSPIPWSIRRIRSSIGSSVLNARARTAESSRSS
jgi:hypothetical protein